MSSSHYNNNSHGANNRKKIELFLFEALIFDSDSIILFDSATGQSRCPVVQTRVCLRFLLIGKCCCCCYVTSCCSG